jgi:SAM-dependent methyltransferase
MAKVSEFDAHAISTGRDHINQFIVRISQLLQHMDRGKLLEIGPQDRSSVRESFTNFEVFTIDIVDTYKPDYVGDITRQNENIADSTFDVIACLDVLEHTLDPFAAIREIRRMLKPGGYLMISAPLNFRIHGPIPDCWRFTEHGFKVLLRDFDNVEIESLETPGRDLFPIHYNAFAQCNKVKTTVDAELAFRFIS